MGGVTQTSIDALPTPPEPATSPVAPTAGEWTPDAVLLVSFGGPEAPDEVVPFLENVTRGTGIPKSRLATVGEHYFLFGGRSPINDQNKALIAALEAELARRGLDIPVYWGNRNWRPYTADAVQQLVADGHRRVAMVTTSAYPSYSGCRSYREELARVLGESPDLDVIDVRRIGNYGLDEGFVAANAEAVQAQLTALPGARLVFVTHSIPTPMSESSGPDGNAYVTWHQQVATRVARTVGVDDFDLVYCSRSGRPEQPWLEPDVNDHLRELHAAGTTSVVLAPIGFVSDHMEVVYDLDTQARETCDGLGMAMGRAATAGTNPVFVATLVDRIMATADQRDPACNDGVCATPCGAESCCPNLRRPETPAIP